jgi:hypothetical protein
VTNSNKYWVGGGTRTGGLGEDYEHAKTAAESAAGTIPIVGEALSAVDLVSALYNMYFSEDSGQSLIYDRTFDHSTSEYQNAMQGGVYNRFEAEGDPGDSGSITAEESAYGFNASLKATVSFDLTYQMPSVSPTVNTSTLQTTNSTDGVTVVKTSDIVKNPSAYGYSPSEARQLAKRKDRVLVANVETDVTVSTSTEVE